MQMDLTKQKMAIYRGREGLSEEGRIKKTGFFTYTFVDLTVESHKYFISL